MDGETKTQDVDLAAVRAAADAIESDEDRPSLLALKVPASVLKALDIIGEKEEQDRSKLVRRWLAELLRWYGTEEWAESLRRQEEIQQLRMQVRELEFTLHVIEQTANAQKRMVYFPRGEQQNADDNY